MTYKELLRAISCETAIPQLQVDAVFQALKILVVEQLGAQARGTGVTSDALVVKIGGVGAFYAGWSKKPSYKQAPNGYNKAGHLLPRRLVKFRMAKALEKELDAMAISVWGAA